MRSGLGRKGKEVGGMNDSRVDMGKGRLGGGWLFRRGTSCEGIWMGCE